VKAIQRVDRVSAIIDVDIMRSSVVQIHISALRGQNKPIHECLRMDPAELNKQIVDEPGHTLLIQHQSSIYIKINIKLLCMNKM